jgi:AraC-like DNA-binding protein
METKASELSLALEGLKSRVDQWTKHTSHLATAISGLDLYREERRNEPHRYTRESAVCLIAQGSKRVVMGSEAFLYDESHYLLASMDVPVVAQILEASPERPYLSLTLMLDLRILSELIVCGDLPPARPKVTKSLLVCKHSLPLIQAFLRLIDLQNEPESIPILAPLIKKEIFFRLLTGEMGAPLRLVASSGTPSAQIGLAIEWLKKNYNQPLRVDDLASYSQMSTTAFHKHFRQLTAMSPLQYQKWLRLQEARRLMLADHFDAAQAAYQVGYESPSQFSREYRRLFETPPSQDIKILRQAPVSNPA